MQVIDIQNYQTKGRPPSRCSPYRVAKLLAPEGSLLTEPMFLRAVNSTNYQLAGNRRLKALCKPGVLVDDKEYEGVVGVVRDYLLRDGRPSTDAAINHPLDRFDSTCPELSAYVGAMRDRNPGDPRQEPFDYLSQLTGLSPNGIDHMCKGYAVPLKVIERLLTRLAPLAGVNVADVRVERVGVGAREPSPVSSVNRQGMV
jgi:hypothetical protein